MIEEDRKKLLLILHLPPSYHGAAAVGEYNNESRTVNEMFECKSINFSTSTKLGEINKGCFRKECFANTIGKQLPSSLLKAPKKGFSVPMKKWFQEKSFQPKLKDLNYNLPFIDKDVLDGLINENESFGGQIKTGNIIWMLFILGRILKK